MRTLAELGDVDFDDRDFVPQWFEPDQGIATIDVMLEGTGRRFSASVRDELVRLREALAEAKSRGCTFHLVETEPGERPCADTAGAGTRDSRPRKGLMPGSQEAGSQGALPDRRG